MPKLQRFVFFHYLKSRNIFNNKQKFINFVLNKIKFYKFISLFFFFLRNGFSTNSVRLIIREQNRLRSKKYLRHYFKYLKRFK